MRTAGSRRGQAPTNNFLQRISLGLILVLLLQKRGTILAVAIMGIVWLFCHYRRLVFISIAIITIVIIVILGYMEYKLLDCNIPNQRSILQRIELYSFALEVFKQNPLLGIGMRSFTQGRYLANYQPKNKNLGDFANVANELQTFDNMLLTGFVEFGSIMTLAYLTLIFYVIIRYCRKEKPFSPKRDAALIPLLPILGLAIHSMTYDSLIFSQINWLFHAQLGILAAQTAIGREDVVAEANCHHGQ